jgi:hypothetical protein
MFCDSALPDGLEIGLQDPFIPNMGGDGNVR